MDTYSTTKKPKGAKLVLLSFGVLSRRSFLDEGVCGRK